MCIYNQIYRINTLLRVRSFFLLFMCSFSFLFFSFKFFSSTLYFYFFFFFFFFFSFFLFFFFFFFFFFFLFFSFFFFLYFFLSFFFFFSSRRRHTISLCDWSSDVCSSDLGPCWGGCLEGSDWSASGTAA